MMVRVAQPCDCTECRWTVRLNVVKIVCFILCDFYHNKKKIKAIVDECDSIDVLKLGKDFWKTRNNQFCLGRKVRK